MKILVTGGAGFIGSHIVDDCLQKGHQVTVLDNLTTGSLNNINQCKNNPNFTFIKADIVNCPDLVKIVSSMDCIYHMAAVIGVFYVLQKPIEVLNTNIYGCKKLLDAVIESKSTPRIIIASSSSAYGNSKKPILKETDELIISPKTHPLWGYAVSKIADEALVSAYYEIYELPITAVRIFNTIGPRQTGRYGMVVPRFVNQAMQGESLTVYGTGNQTRSFCDVRDTIAALSLIADNNISLGEPINVGNDTETTINKLADMVREIASSHSSIKYVSYKEAYGRDFKDIDNRRPDLSKLINATQFKHKYQLEDTIKDLVARYRDEQSKQPKEEISKT